jgi:hypothetical protein
MIHTQAQLPPQSPTLYNLPGHAPAPLCAPPGCALCVAAACCCQCGQQCPAGRTRPWRRQQQQQQRQQHNSNSANKNKVSKKQVSMLVERAAQYAWRKKCKGELHHLLACRATAGLHNHLLPCSQSYDMRLIDNQPTSSTSTSWSCVKVLRHTCPTRRSGHPP